MTDWSNPAEWYDEKIGDVGDDWHRTLLDPAHFAYIDDVIGQRVLLDPFSFDRNEVSWLCNSHTVPGLRLCGASQAFHHTIDLHLRYDMSLPLTCHKQCGRLWMPGRRVDDGPRPDARPDG